jgi:hypothetical protein
MPRVGHPGADDVAEGVNYRVAWARAWPCRAPATARRRSGPLDDTVLIKTPKLQEVAVDSANRRARVWTSWQERKTALAACLFARCHRL